ncbi:MAG: molybdopterin-dependent oxidoreductase [Candidatus Omnitrophota bacterium]
MKARRILAIGIVASILLSLPLLAALFIGEHWRLFSFVPFDIFDWLSRVIPGYVITVVIDAMVRFIAFFNVGPTDIAAKIIEQLMGIGIFIFLLAIIGFLNTWGVIRFSKKTFWIGLCSGLFLSFALIPIQLFLRSPMSENFSTAFALVIWAIVHAFFVRQIISVQKPLTWLAGLTGFSVLLAGTLMIAGRAIPAGPEGLAMADRPLNEVRPSTEAFGVMKAAASAAQRSGIFPVPGTREEITPNEKFFRIDINTLPPRINLGKWKVRVEGLFTRARDLAFEDLMKYPEVTVAATLSCISNPVGGDLISTGFFTGVRLIDVLKDLGIRKEAKALEIRAEDGYYETVVYEDMIDPRTLLVYGLNGKTLSVEQGFPLRIFIANRYGMKQPKWITQIKAVETIDEGYWVERGWSFEAHPQTVSVIDIIVKTAQSDGTIPIGGIAWAGDRGIQKVEIQIDGGEWTEVKLLNPPLSPLAWVLWRYDWPFQPGRHTFRVRAVDGTGKIQAENRSDPHPAGATGYHQIEMTF